MSDILQSSDFGLKMYHRFPRRYQEEDIFQKYALKRYLEALADGGMKYIIEDTNRLLTLVNSDECDSEVLPILYKQYGLDVFNGIPETFLRALIPHLGEAYSKKGSMAVVEFIVSSLSGIRTDTEVHYDENGNPFVDVRLEMDFALSNYFPDPNQFSRLLENFMPFYVDKVLIYAYMFYEQGNLQAIDSDFMRVTHDVQESGLIPYCRGTKISPMLCIDDCVLGDNFILGGTFYVAEDPDIFFDVIGNVYSENGEIKTSKITPLLGTNKLLNNDFILGGNDDIDDIFDVIGYSPINDIQPLFANDNLSENISVLEADTSNFDGEDTDSINVLSQFIEDGVITRNGDSLEDEISVAVNSEETTIGTSDDIDITHIKIGEEISALEMLGTIHKLNADFVLGNNQDEFQYLNTEDTDIMGVSLEILEDHKSIGVIDDNNNILMFTGVDVSVLGEAITSVPEAHDVVVQSGVQRVYYPTTYGYIG